MYFSQLRTSTAYSKHLFNEQTSKHEANIALYIFVSPLQQILTTTIQYLQTVMDWEICQQFSVSTVALIWLKPWVIFQVSAASQLLLHYSCKVNPTNILLQPISMVSCASFWALLEAFSIDTIARCFISIKQYLSNIFANCLRTKE